MQAVSDEFKQMCKSNTPSGALGRIRILENNITISESTDIQNIQIEDNCYVNGKFIGTTVAKKVTVNLFNDENKYDLENKEIEVKLGFQHYDQEQIYQGKRIQIDNAKPVNPYITLNGESIQNGTPTLDTPIEIENVEGNVKVKVINENFLKCSRQYDQTVNGVTCKWNGDGTYTLNGTATAQSDIYIEAKNWGSLEEITTLKAGKSYTMSIGVAVTGLGMNLYSFNPASKNIKNMISVEKTIITPTEDIIANLVYLRINKGVTLNNVIVKPMLYEGIEERPFKQYQEQTVYFPLTEGQKLMEGSYLADDGVHNVFCEEIVNGTSMIFTNAKLNGKYYCSQKVSGNLEGQIISFEEPVINAIIQYELAEEEIVPYTEEQQEAWEKIKTFNLYNGTNHINSNANMLVILEKEEFISYGNFIIEKPETEEVEAKTNFIGYDYMIKFNKLFIDNNTYPISLGEYFSNLCNQVGVEAGSIDFVNSDYVVQGNTFTNNEDCRTVLSAIAQIAGGIAKIGRDNKVYIINLSAEDTLEGIDGNNYDAFTPNKIFGPINKVILKMNSGVNGEESVRSDEESIIQNGECAITISDNPILNSAEQRELVVDNILNILRGITYLPFKTSYYGYPYSDSTDKIKILNVNDTEYNSYIFNHTIVYDGAFAGNIDTSALTKTQSMYKNTLDFKTRFKNTELQVDKINGKITSIIEEQEDIKGKANSISQDIDATTARIEKIENETNVQINELKETVEGVSNTLTKKGGNNLFYYDKDFWDSEDTLNIEEYSDTEIIANSVSGKGYLIGSGTSVQSVDVQNGTYTISFRYKKIGVELASASVKINNKTFDLESTEWTDFVKTIDVTTNNITIEFISDTNDTLYVVDLLANIGSEKEIWTQNPNEIRTDTVKIGKGIEIESTERNTIHKIGADGNRTYNKNTGELVAELTDKGLEAEEIISRGQAQIAGVLIKQVRKSNMVFKFIIKLKNEQ